MQFIPSTWSGVGVDGDGDGVRNPQDIDDAALATAVYLCSGDEDLSTDAGQRAAVYRYNHSEEYVDLVLSIMRAYSTGDYAAVPNASYSSPVFTPSYGDAVMTAPVTGYQPPKSTPRSRSNASFLTTSASLRVKRASNSRRVAWISGAASDSVNFISHLHCGQVIVGSSTISLPVDRRID